MASLTLTHLTYAASTKPKAQIVFDPKLTLIYGASDTGKSFIVESIDYMLGGADLTLVPEAEGYSQILLGLRLPDGSLITLVRAPGTKTIGVYQRDLRDIVHALPDVHLSAIHHPRSARNISRYLLDELGLDQSRIRTNEAGRTKTLRLRDLVHLAVVTETRMVDTTAPALHSSRPAGQTAAKSVVKLLLTGEGEPDTDTGPNPVQRRVHKGKISLLDQLVLDLTAKLTTQENDSQLSARLARIRHAIREHSSSLHEATDRHTAAVAARTQITEDAAQLAGRLNEVRELLARFKLLRRQYESDLARLAMVNEASSLLGYFSTGDCPFCGAARQHQSANHTHHETTQLHNAVIAETVKTQQLLADLLTTITDLEEQEFDLYDDHTTMTAKGERLDRQIAAAGEELAPLREHLDELLAQRSVIERERELHARIQELEDARALLVAEGSVPEGRPAGHIPARVLTAFDTVLQRTLDAWHVPGVANAEYDQYTGEVRAGGRSRAGRGKGVRSVLHSAFSLSLAQFCIERSLPHPGFVVLDSPVVTYREPGSVDEVLPTKVVDHFYRHLLGFPGQAIVVENGDPPADVIGQTYIYMFSGQDRGRRGFIPDDTTTLPTQTGGLL